MIIGVAVVAAATLYAVITKFLLHDRDFDIVLDRDAGVTISAKSGEGIEKLIDRAFAESPASVGGILQERDYFKLHSDGLITALALTDPSELPAGTLERYRKLLWNLEGPFEPPGTLSQMDERLLIALEDLEDEVRETGRSNQLIAAIWQQSLNRQGIFRQRLVNAEVVLISGNGDTGPAGFPQFYTCTGSELVNRVVTVGAARGAEGIRWKMAAEPLTGLVRANPFKLPCTDEGASLPELLAGKPLVLGLHEDTYAKLFELEMGSNEPREARVQVEALQLPQ